ncbi:MAG: hypothetical protein HOV80_07630 [Polyangiaceae bacterium]|nr:hypothetical protein [Polyangiaceae bacterium]
MLRIRDLLLHTLLLAAATTSGCTCGPAGPETVEEGAGGEGGGGGQEPNPFPCGVDCAAINTPPCTVAVCNTGQELGPLNQCVVITAADGASCDDGVFCTMADSCVAGVCNGGVPNDCGLPHSPCEAILCVEDLQSCDIAPVNDGTACTPEDLCRVDGVCELGECNGVPKPCGISPLAECNNVECDPATGQCLGTPDPNKDFLPCVLTGDPCQVDKTCESGACTGGNPKSCSQLDAGCEIGVCDPPTGICLTDFAPAGASCGNGVTECQDGFCDGNGVCKAEPAMMGLSCNDHDACTATEGCTLGICDGGTPVAGCSLYFNEGFEVCPNGWTFGGDWQCGDPENVGPPAAKNGWQVIATKIGSVYSINQSYDTAVADSPPINLAGATSPVLSFWAWEHTEGGSFDGWNLKISTNGGADFTQVPAASVTPTYNLTVGGQPAWGGNHSTEGWHNFQVDLSAYAGQSVILRFAFRSDGATVQPGVYIDDIFVAEPLQNPLYIASASFPTLYAGMPVTVPMAKMGGTPGAVWSIVPGGTNDDWLDIDPVTGVLSGTPTVADVGPVSVTVRVEEGSLPSNYDVITLQGDVIYAAYYTGFEGPCPNGWTLANTWQCGTPSVLVAPAAGPPTAYGGSQCLATILNGNYLDNQTFSTATATSPSVCGSTRRRTTTGSTSKRAPTAA